MVNDWMTSAINSEKKESLSIFTWTRQNPAKIQPKSTIAPWSSSPITSTYHRHITPLKALAVASSMPCREALHKAWGDRWICWDMLGSFELQSPKPQPLHPLPRILVTPALASSKRQKLTLNSFANPQTKTHLYQTTSIPPSFLRMPLGHSETWYRRWGSVPVHHTIRGILGMFIPGSYKRIET